MVYLVAFLSIALSAIAQYFLKIGVGQLSWLTTTSFRQKIDSLVTNWPLIGGVGCYVLSMIFWLYVLSKMEMSKAYPLVSIGYIFTLLIGHFLLGESVSLFKVVGIVLIVLGVFFITRA